MAKSNKQKLERLHKLSLAFNDVSKAVIDILESDTPKFNDHIDTVKSALVMNDHDGVKALQSAREMVFCLRDNRDLYKKLKFNN